MATATDVLRIAAGEIGYSRWDDPETGTKYGRWYAQKTGSSYYAQNGVPYCAMFVSWCLDQAGQSVPGFPMAYCPSGLSDATNAGLAVNKYNAQPGDIVFFDWGGDGESDHVGLVEGNYGSYLQTCEGNALPLDTLVLTTTGWKKIKDVEIGESMVDPILGEKSEVLGKYYQGIRPCYEIVFSDGRSIVADENHLWEVRRRNSQVWEVKTTKELFEDPSRYTCQRILTPVQYDITTPLPLDPWVVGMVIGDGCLTRNCLYIANSDTQMIQKLIEKLGSPSRVYKKDNSQYGYKTGVTLEWRDKELNRIGRELNLLGKTWKDKKIPPAYLTASVADRICLLQGLLDSDGTCDKGGRAAFCTGNKDLAYQVRDLVFSLGGHCGIYEHHPLYTLLSTGEKKRGSISYRVSNINVPFNPFTKKTKQEKYFLKKKHNGYAITDITPVSAQETVCIKVSASSHLYIAEDWIVTHNTSSSTGGSQSNGGCVARKTRSFGVVCGVIRPRYGQEESESTPQIPDNAEELADSTLDVDGYWGKATTAKLQKALGTTVDGIVSNQPIANKSILASCVPGGSFQFTSACGGGSSVIASLQRLLGVEDDGWFGTDSIKALQTYLGTEQDGCLSEESYCVQELQKRLNAGTFVSGGSASSPAQNPTPAPAREELDVDGWFGPATIRALQKALGTPVDGVVSDQYRGNIQYLPHAGDGWEFSYNVTGGSAMIRALQQKIGTEADGLFGYNSVRALQASLGVEVDGYMGNDTVCSLQRKINGGGFGDTKTDTSQPTTTPTYNSILRGIDVSSYDGFNGSTFKSDTESCYQASDFVITKVTQGDWYVHNSYDAIYRRAKNDGKLLGVYHYAEGKDPETEAQFFYDHIKSYIGEAIPCIDWESGSNRSWGDTNWVRRFVNKMHDLTGIWCMIYVQASAVYQVANCANDCALWVAGYPTDSASWDVPTFRYSVSPWPAYTVWQFTSSNDNTDRNVANVDAEGWKRIAKG